jgi:predicted CXXCH cytochrome family protein
VRTRTAKKLAQRIDLNYFKHPTGIRRWRTLLSLAVPLAAVLWLVTLAASGNRTIYSSGPVSSAHAFVAAKCEVCHAREESFRAHVTDKSCLTCHDAPGHRTSPHSTSDRTPECATCHREHQGRVQLAATADKLCVDCHGDLAPHAVRGFPAGHAEFAAVRDGARDPGTIRFNHDVHNSRTLRGPNGTEPLECTTCHKPEIARLSSQKKLSSGLMSSIRYEQQCARCHPLFFDERVEAQAPHEPIAIVRPFVRQALADFVRANPQAISEPDRQGRRIPLNFPLPPEPPARSAEEWVARRTARADRLFTQHTCAYCHGDPVDNGGADGSPRFAPANLRREWMPRARFDHTPHLMVECASCHAGVEKSRRTSDVLMPAVSTCATCHAPTKGAGAQCVDCHGYHDWTNAQPVKPHFKLTDFQ